MPNIPLQDTFIIKIAGYILAIIGPIIGLCGILVGYIYTTDRKQDRSEHRELFNKTDDHSERISKVEGKLKL